MVTGARDDLSEYSSKNRKPAFESTSLSSLSSSSSLSWSEEGSWEQQQQPPLLLQAALVGDARCENSPPLNLFPIQSPRPGTGFDNFLPKNKKPGSSSNNSNDSQAPSEKKAGDGKPDLESQEQHQTTSSGGDPQNDNKNKKEDQKDQQQQRGGGGPNSNPGWSEVGWAVLLFFLYTQRDRIFPSSSTRSPKDSSSGSDEAIAGIQNNDLLAMMPRELAWHDLLRLLHQRAVTKIVVTEERQMARVYVKPSHRGGSGALPDELAWSTNPLAATSMSTMANSTYPAASTHDDRNKGGSGVSGVPEPSSDHDGYHEQVQDQVDGLSHGNGTMHLTSPLQLHVSSQPLFYLMQIGSMDSFERKLDEAQRALGRDPREDVPVQYATNVTLASEIFSTIPGLIFALLVYGMIRMANGAALGGTGAGGRGGVGGIFQIGKSTAKKINKQDVTVRFSDVAGCEEAKKEIMEFVDFLKDSDRFTELGAKIPKGALLCGPPGTGKTLLAKAVAGEAGVPFFSVSGSDFIEMFVGVGPSRVRDLFQDARQNAPCIVFIDEIDAIGRQRGRGGIGGNDERENTLNQLLVEMDGFEPSTGVVVLAGTNRVDILDQALTRPGRFDRKIQVDKPDLKGRKAIFKVHLKGITLSDELEDVASRLAGLTPGFAGADIANLCNEAAIVAARRKGETVTMADFEKATDRIIGGLESNKIMSTEERRIVAHHEAGHAVAGWFLEHADPLLKVTIIPRSSGALGFAQYLPKEIFLRTQEQIMDIVCMALAGRASEEIFFGRVTTGASDDLQKVTNLVYSTIQLYGMNSRLGQLSFPKDPGAMFEDRPYSEKTAKAMDEEARRIVDEAYQRTLDLLQNKKEQVQAIAQLLLDKETISHDDLVATIGSRPFLGDQAYEEFIQRRKIDRQEHDKKDKNSTANNESHDPTETTELHPGLA